MNQAARIRWNSLFSLLSSGIRLVTNVFLFLGLARFYGPEAFGQFTTAHTLATLFLVLADFGLDVLFTTEVARQRDQAGQLFHRFAAVKLLLAIGAMAGMCVLPMAHDFSPVTRWLIYIFSLSVIFNAAANFLYALFRGFEQLRHETLGTFIANLLLLLALILLGVLRAPIAALAFLFVGTRALALALAAVNATRFIKLQIPSFNLGECLAVMKKAWTFGLHLIFEISYFQLDTLLLSLWQGDYAVGIYQSVMKLVFLVLVLPDVGINALLPALARYYAEDKQKWAWLGELLNRTLWLLALPFALVFIVYAEPVIRLLYGLRDYAPAVPLMRVAGGIILVRFAFATYGPILMTSGRQRSRMFIMMIATFISIGFNAYAIPRYGSYGAICVSLIANFFVAMAFFASERVLFARWTINVRHLVPAILMLALGALLWHTPLLPYWFGIILMLAFYVLIVYFVGYSKAEWRMIMGGALHPLDDVIKTQDQSGDR